MATNYYRPGEYRGGSTTPWNGNEDGDPAADGNSSLLPNYWWKPSALGWQSGTCMNPECHLQEFKKLSSAIMFASHAYDLNLVFSEIVRTRNGDPEQHPLYLIFQK